MGAVVFTIPTWGHPRELWDSLSLPGGTQSSRADSSSSRAGPAEPPGRGQPVEGIRRKLEQHLYSQQPCAIELYF